MANHVTDEIDSFKKNWQNSSASKLLIPDINSAELKLRKYSDFRASIALMAFKNGCLPTLDCLMDRYDISQKGTKDFKKRLQENWLEDDAEKRRNNSNQVISGITELAAAYFLENKGFEIKHLAAWKMAAWKNPNDISCCKNGKDFGFEVKLFPDPPEIYKLRHDAAKSESGVACDSTSPHPVALNYYYFRLAEAIIQLGKSNSDNPAIFFVFTEGVNQFFIEELIKSFGKRKEWYKEEKEEAICIPGIPLKQDKLRDEVLSKTPDEWFNETKILYIAKMKKYCIDCIYSRSVFPEN